MKEPIILRVKVQPRAARNELAGWVGDELKVRLTAPPVDSAANRALVEFLADQLGCPRHAIALIRGLKSRHKTVVIQGVDSEGLRQRLDGK